MIDAAAVLAATRTTEYSPASNVKGVVAGATWRYLLPSMEVARALIVGRTDAATLRALGRTAEEIVVIGGGPAPAAGTTAPAPTVVPGADAAGWLAERPAGSIDLVFVTDAPPPVAGLEAGHERILASGAVVVRERRGRLAASPGPSSAGGPARPRSWPIAVRPDRGDVRAATGVADDVSARLLADRNLAGPAIRLRGPRRLARLVGRLAPERHRRLELVLPEGATTLPAPPSWLVGLAAADGVDLSHHRAALSAVGDYNTQKVLLVLRVDEASEAAVVVKLTRDPSVNRRLETERDALRLLAAIPELAGGRVPRVVFAGRHAGLAVVGETALHGRPYGAPGGPDVDAVAADALGWLTTLGERTVQRAAAGDVAAALADLHERFVALCQPTPDETARLREAIEAIRASTEPFPLVLQHGDPGTWNLLVGDDGRAAFLDWENADAAGMPLWDLLYLLRSYAVGTARRAGIRRRLAGVERFLFGASRLSDTIVGAVGGYARRVGLEASLIEPVFHLCWMHQALKEATRTEPRRVRDAHYNRLLRLGLERRSAPTLRRIFAGEGA